MLGNLSFGEVLVILVVALLIFGPSKLPQLGRAAGQTLREFKKGVHEVMEDEEKTKVKKSES
ncbi:Sec-independent protein translocase protein TatA [Weizmannia acidilactici]|uniref:Sec-independent protein translocase protein TatA n=1 Tax=Weizmannia acidilactici TaxID=2607726 RepID=A0A5J4JA88_9BACI|nr:twin-arginine translocase TatA/TatE family subunit [Weizmannia acidilactici]GER66716.1 Sec-independent protein translocase protein TatA [Weizmannia acidilactici]GER71722.1 Sec-independent protein translocase protein TatA [Weizmannia acidilactici]GER72870.1 Sec-independent protein translocase protein TatA [Weizmannia acidilactici]